MPRHNQELFAKCLRGMMTNHKVKQTAKMFRSGRNSYTSLIGLILVLCMTLLSRVYGEDMVKEPNVAGAFYSADRKELSAYIDDLKQSAGGVPADRKVQVVLAPHAGYVYSGPVAAHSFKAIARNHYKTVVVIAPSHFFPFEGISVWPRGAFKTPLGVMPVDEEFAKALLKENSKFQFLPQVFEREHAIEVELPFLQKTFAEVRIVPILMGQPDFKVCQDLAAALDKLIGRREDVLLLISSDMSHYHTYEAANRMDAGTLKAIEEINPQKLFNGCLSGDMEMCGFVPVTTALMFAKLRGLQHADVLKYANSGDTAGDKSRVVGYSSVIFYSQLLDQGDRREAVGVAPLTQDQKKGLLKIARTTVETFVKTGKAPQFETQDKRLNAQEGAFVTIRKHGALRGCIGNIIGQKPLFQTVRDMAVAAASQDPRFHPVTLDELKDIDIEISVLSKPQRVQGASAIELGKHGVIVSDGGFHQGVFLPQVATETGWSKEEFLSQLCSQKAGLAPDAWKDPGIMLYTFTADVFAQ